MIHRRWPLFISLTLWVSLLSGCAELAFLTRDPQSEWSDRQAALSSISHWEARGRVGLRLSDDSSTANLRWRQMEADFDILLSGPLGQGVGRLEGRPGAVLYRSAKGETVRAASAEALMNEQLGWQLPVSGLRYWLTGQPTPTSPIDRLEIDDQGRLSRLKQLGWEVEYLRYDETRHPEMPTSVRLTRPGVRGKFLLNDWTVQ